MKKNSAFLFLYIITAASILFFSCSRRKSVMTDAVIIYTYDSFSSPSGPGPEIRKKFKEKTGFNAVFVGCGDANQTFTKAVFEKRKPYADIIIGIDRNLAANAGTERLLYKYKPADAETVIPKELQKALGSRWRLTPYDYSYFSVIYDRQSNVPAPESLEDLIKPEYAEKLILMDPRTSLPGIGFLSWTFAQFGEEAYTYWRALKPSIMTMTADWSEGYRLFEDGEAPLIISYVTSAAYHTENSDHNRYEALVFDEGHILQVEGAGIIKGAHNLKGAKAFMDFLISKEAQEIIPRTQWMFPVNKNAELPECYETVPIPEKTLDYSTEEVNKSIAEIIHIIESN